MIDTYTTSQDWELTRRASFRGTTEAPYDTICEAFGDPTDIAAFDAGDSRWEWIVLFDDGRIATIYDRHQRDLEDNAEHFCDLCSPSDGLPDPLRHLTNPRMVGAWYIGGSDPSVVASVCAILADRGPTII